SSQAVRERAVVHDDVHLLPTAGVGLRDDGGRLARMPHVVVLDQERPGADVPVDDADVDGVGAAETARTEEAVVDVEIERVPARLVVEASGVPAVRLRIRAGRAVPESPPAL